MSVGKHLLCTTSVPCCGYLSPRTQHSTTLSTSVEGTLAICLTFLLTTTVTSCRTWSNNYIVSLWLLENCKRISRCNLLIFMKKTATKLKQPSLLRDESRPIDAGVWIWGNSSSALSLAYLTTSISQRKLECILNELCYKTLFVKHNCASFDLQLGACRLWHCRDKWFTDSLRVTFRVSVTHKQSWPRQCTRDPICVPVAIVAKCKRLDSGYLRHNRWPKNMDFVQLL